MRPTQSIHKPSSPPALALALLGFILALAPAGIVAQTVWTKYEGNPVLEVGPTGSWDDNYLIEPYVLFDDTTYHMWYGGEDGSSNRIGHATSPDGVDWTKDSLNPVLGLGPSGSWEDNEVTASWVLYDGTTYHMWYHGHDGTSFRIGHATSLDGVDWTKDSLNPVLGLGPSGSWDDRHVETPVVLMLDDTTFFMWYGGSDGNNTRIGLATSSDGVVWEKWGTNPVMDRGTGWEGRSIFPEAVLLIDDTLRMWYLGLNSAFVGRSGYATSSDGGVVWDKYAGNPVLDVGEAGAWDNVAAAVGAVLFDGTTYEMWYDSWDGGNNGSIGYATAPDSIPSTVSIAAAGVVPEKYVLSQNYPNPFNPGTVIEYTLPQAGPVTLVVLDLLGREVRRWQVPHQAAGTYTVQWDGSDGDGNPVATGMYLYQLEAGRFSEAKKMVLIR